MTLTTSSCSVRNMAQEQPVEHHLRDLRVPREFAKYDTQTDAEVIVRLEQWKQRACNVLSALRESLHNQDAVASEIKAEIIYRVSAFDGDGPWVSDFCRAVAQGKLCPLGSLKIHVDASRQTSYPFSRIQTSTCWNLFSVTTSSRYLSSTRIQIST